MSLLTVIGLLALVVVVVFVWSLCVVAHQADTALAKAREADEV